MRSSSSPRPSSGKRFFFAWIFPSVFVLMGACILIWGIGVLLQGRESEGWPGVEGVVTSSSVGKRSTSANNKTRTSFVPQVVYDYVVDGRTYTGKRVAFDAGHGSSDPADARAKVSRYPKGATVTVYYRPRDPRESVLEPGVASAAWGPFAIGAVFFSLGIAGLYFMPRAIARGLVHVR